MQDYITIYDAEGNPAETVAQVIDSHLNDRLDGTLTLSFTSKFGRLPEIAADTLIEFRGQYYRATQVQSSVSGHAFLVSVSCEQESISLVDMEIEEFNFTGTADDALARLLDGTGITATAEHTGTITVSASGGNRRSVLLEIVELCEGEIEYSGHHIYIRKRRGNTEPIDIVQVCQCSDVTKAFDLRNGTESYEITGQNPTGYAVGDEVILDFAPLGIHVQKRIIGISYNPFDCRSVSIETGDYIKDITDDYASLEKIFLLKADAKIEFEKYINSAEGTAGIAAALSGTFVTQDALNDLVTTSELDARIDAYINGEEGIASITESLMGTFVTEDELEDFSTKTEVSTQIKQEVNNGIAALTLSAEETAVTEHVPTDEVVGAYENYIPEYIGEYAFEFTDGYFTSLNKGTNSSFAIGVIEFAFTEKTVVALECINYAEENCDYGMIGNIDVTLEKSSTADSSDKLFYSFYEKSSPDVVTLYLTVPAGNHRIEVKFIKDGSYSYYNDCFKIRAVATETKTTSSKSTITLTAGGVEISSADITFEGFVTFESLSTPGATTIDGANIDTENLYVENIYLGGDSSRKILTSNLGDSGGTVEIGFIQDYGSSSYGKVVKIYADYLYIIPPGGSETDDEVLIISPKSMYFGANGSGWNFDIN